jgi:hypothetical protein
LPFLSGPSAGAPGAYSDEEGVLPVEPQVLPLVGPLLEPLKGIVGDRNHPIPSTLAIIDADLAALQVHVAAAQVTDLGHAQTGPQHDLQHATVAQTGGGPRAHGFQQRLRFVGS